MSEPSGHVAEDLFSQARGRDGSGLWCKCPEGLAASACGRKRMPLDDPHLDLVVHRLGIKHLDRLSFEVAGHELHSFHLCLDSFDEPIGRAR